MELDLICPRLPRLIRAPFGTLNHILSKLESHTAQSGCYGVLSYNNLTSRRSETAFICWPTGNVRPLVYALGHILSLLKLAFCSSPPYKPSLHNEFVLLISFCIHYTVERLHLFCIPPAQNKLQAKSDTVPGFIGAFLWLLRSSLCKWHVLHMNCNNNCRWGMFYRV